MSGPLLLKGFEVEMYTGWPDGTVVGCAAEAAGSLPGFVTEPDNRNLEYTTVPEANYGRQLQLLLEPRSQLRQWLQPRGLTILPGSTLSLGDSGQFVRSDPSNDYHAIIERTYGTRVVTASVHINLGLDNTHQIFTALRLMRCEGALLLALSCSSPFLDGAVTGAQSQRWLQFPLTPPQVPLFQSHAHYVAWMGEQLAAGAMHNVRHLWTSVRPNGDNRPHDLNRVEIRICDLISDARVLCAITAWAELRVLQLLQDEDRLDPLRASRFTAPELALLADANDRAVARDGLDAVLRHWRDGRAISARDWIETERVAMAPLAADLQLETVLAPLTAVLRDGNEASLWLARQRQGESIRAIISSEARAMERRDISQLASVATDRTPLLG